MTGFQTHDQHYASRIRESFSKQGFMGAIGAELVVIAPGEVQVSMPFRDALTQQHGFIHAGVVTTLVDNACGYAALTLMAPDAEVLTVEYKVNFLSPARGEKFIATGRVIKPGKTITFCQGEVVAVHDGREKTVATMSATMMAVGSNKKA